MGVVLSSGNAHSRSDVYNSFRNQGLSHTEAANFTGVVSSEGGYKGGVFTGSFGSQSTENGGVLNRGGAFGIAQWNGSRQAGLANFAQSNGMQPGDLDAQTGFAVSEARGRGINLNSTSDIVNRFEVPRQDLRAGEIASANRIAGGFSESDYNGGGTFRSASNGSGPGSVETDAGDGTIKSFSDNGDGSANVTLGGSDPSSTANGGAGSGGTGTASQQSAVGSQSNSGSGSGGSGFGAFMTDVGRAVGNALAPATQKSGEVQAAATKAAGTTVAKGSTDAASTLAGQSKANATVAADSFKDYFGRFVVILLGLIFVAGGIAMFVFNKDPIKLAANVVKGK